MCRSKPGRSPRMPGPGKEQVKGGGLSQHWKITHDSLPGWRRPTMYHKCSLCRWDDHRGCYGTALKNTTWQPGWFNTINSSLDSLNWVLLLSTCVLVELSSAMIMKEFCIWYKFVEHLLRFCWTLQNGEIQESAGTIPNWKHGEVWRLLSMLPVSVYKNSQKETHLCWLWIFLWPCQSLLFQVRLATKSTFPSVQPKLNHAKLSLDTPTLQKHLRKEYMSLPIQEVRWIVPSLNLVNSVIFLCTGVWFWS